MPKLKAKYFDIARIPRGKEVFKLRQVLKNEDKRFRSDSFRYPKSMPLYFRVLFYVYVATRQEMVSEKKLFKVREKSGNFTLSQGKLIF